MGAAKEGKALRGPPRIGEARGVVGIRPQDMVEPAGLRSPQMKRRGEKTMPSASGQLGPALARRAW